jgi:hypothetical protein
MQRSAMIVLGTPAAALPPPPKSRSPAARHWRNWRRSGVALSGLLHVIVLAALTVSVPVFGRPAPSENAIPVELVPNAPEKNPAEREEPKKPEKERKRAEPNAPSKPEAKAAPEPPKPPAPAPVPAAKPTPQPAAPMPEAPRPAPSPVQPPPTLAPAPPPPEAGLPPVPPPVPDAVRPNGPPQGLKLDADEAPPPGERRAVGYWVLEPLTADLRSRCGLARITGVLELREQLGEGRYRGLIRTRIAWTHCPAEGAVHAVELRIKGGEVQMIGADGFVDRGAVSGNTMMLEDAYGRSVWKKR